jgi:predicted DsbA family dithiol-disulfide isomerase
MDMKRQYKFMDLLFQTQETWAFTEDTTPLYQNAKLAGMSAESIESCVDDSALEKTLLESVQKGRTTYSVSSTPTVVAFPTKEKLKGLHNYKTVKKQIQRALKAAEE